MTKKAIMQAVKGFKAENKCYPAFGRVANYYTRVLKSDCIEAFVEDLKSCINYGAENHELLYSDEAVSFYDKNKEDVEYFYDRGQISAMRDGFGVRFYEAYNEYRYHLKDLESFKVICGRQMWDYAARQLADFLSTEGVI